MTARELPDSSSIHTCSYYCDRPACVMAQRDQMRDAMFAESDGAQRVSEEMVEAGCAAGAPVADPGLTWPQDYDDGEQAQARKLVRAILEAALGARGKES